MLLPAEIIAPLELLQLPVTLDGRAGSNRARADQARISADNDVDAIKAWLARAADKKTTLDTYRKEAERLLLWCAIECCKPLSSITHEDWLLYKTFLKHPTPAALWVSAEGRKYPRAPPAWRPFAGPLSASSQRQTAVILNALFSWLVNAGYLAGNPLALSRHRKPRGAPRLTRYLDDGIWVAVKETIEAMPRDTPRQLERYRRDRWLFSVLYVCALRISELIGTLMGAFFVERDRDGVQRWWLEVVGKGDKVRIVPATSELMVELRDYRLGYGLAPYPYRGDVTPLLMPLGGAPRAMSRGGVHVIIKEVFGSTANRLRGHGDVSEGLAERVIQASAHWLRHTAGSHMANHDLDLRHVRDNLGHESLTTTSGYLHSADHVRHAETDAKHKVGW